MSDVPAQPISSGLPEPLRRGFLGALKDIFGQFSTRSYWRKVAEDLVQAAIHAFFIALGQSFIRVGTQGKGAEVNSMASSIASKAFGAQPPAVPSSYQPASPYAPPRDIGHPTFPGFR